MAGLIVRILTWFASGLIFRAISAFGLGVFSIYFINSLLDQAISAMADAITGLPPAPLALLGLAGMDKYLSIILGAVVMMTYLRSMKLILTRE